MSDPAVNNGCIPDVKQEIKLKSRRRLKSNNGKRRSERKRHDLFWKIVLIAGDLLMVNISFAAAFWLRFHIELWAPLPFVQPVEVPPIGEYLKALVLVNYTWLLLFAVFGLYDREHRYSTIDVIHKIVKAVTLSAVFVISLTFFFREFSYSRSVCITAWFFNILLMILFRWSVEKLEDRMREAGVDVKNVLIIGSDNMARYVAQKLNQEPKLGFHILGYVDGTRGDELMEGLACLGALGELADIVEAHPVDEVILTRTDLGHYDLLELVSFCELSNIRLKMVPTVYDLLIDYADVYDLDGVPMVTLQEKPLNQASLFIKRIFDIVLSLVLLLLSIPLWIVIVAAIKIDSPGRAVFRQKRSGKDGIPFDMYKFRTMVLNAPQLLNNLLQEKQLPEPVFKMPDDPRTTRVGKFLRKSSLDELPQLLNVLKGDMSFVGPRPEETIFVDQYDIWQRRRLKVKPGITGLQQIICRGTTSLAQRVKYDIYYIRKRSFLLDLWILIKTVPVVFSGKGAS